MTQRVSLGQHKINNLKDAQDRLVESCIKGERAAQEKLYAQYSAAMYVVCLRYTKSQQEAEDVLQESFIKVFEKLPQFRKDASLGAWVKKVVVNTALNSQRSKLYMYPMSDVRELSSASDQELVLSGFHFQALLTMIQALPEGCQVIFNMYAIEGYSHKEIAEALNISVGTSKSQYARAKVLLREKVEQSEITNYGQAR